jgi:hemerythrin
MDWKETYVLGNVPMDDTHQHFVNIVTKLGQAESADEVLACMDELIAHTIEHFAQEKRWMLECGFPPLHCHDSEHDRVLQSLINMRPNLQADSGIARILVKELEAWFAQHAATMDDALAFFMRQVAYVPTPGSAKQ